MKKQISVFELQKIWEDELARYGLALAQLNQQMNKNRDRRWSPPPSRSMCPNCYSRIYYDKGKMPGDKAKCVECGYEYAHGKTLALASVTKLLFCSNCDARVYFRMNENWQFECPTCGYIKDSDGE